MDDSPLVDLDLERPCFLDRDLLWRRRFRRCIDESSLLLVLVVVEDDDEVDASAE
jgi:hypothetical protein